MKLWLAIFATSLSFPIYASQSMAFQAEKSVPRTTAKAAMSGAAKKQLAEAPETNQRGVDAQGRFPFGSFQDTECRLGRSI